MSGLEEWEIEAELSRLLGDALVAAMTADDADSPTWFVNGAELFVEGWVKLPVDALAMLKRRFPDRDSAA